MDPDPLKSGVIIRDTVKARCWQDAPLYQMYERNHKKTEEQGGPTAVPRKAAIGGNPKLFTMGGRD